MAEVEQGLSSHSKAAGRTLVEFPLWTCQSIEFGKGLGRALRELHQVPISGQIPESRIRAVPSFHQSLKECKKIWTQQESAFEVAGFPIVVLEEVFMGFEGIGSSQAANEKVSLHGRLQCQNIFLNEKAEFSGFRFGEKQYGNRGHDLAVAWMIFEEPVAKAFFETYGPVDETQFELSLFCSLSQSIQLLSLGSQMNDENLKQWSTFALRKSLGF